MEQAIGLASGRHESKFKRVLIWLVVVVIVAGICYLLGLREGRSPLADCRERLARVQAELKRVQAVNGVLRAQRQLYRAAAELDRRNFGTANDDVVMAAKLLRSVDPEIANVEATELDALRREVAATSINVALDLQEQRAHLADLAERLDNLMPEQGEH